MHLRERLPLRNKPLLQSAVIFALVFGVAMAPWPRLGRAFCGGYAVAAAAAFAPVLPPEAVTFWPSVPGDQHEEWDLLIRFRPATGATFRRGIRVEVRRVGYVPLVFLAALAIGFPARDRRHLAIAAAGCVAALVFLQAVALFSAFTARGVVSLGSGLNLLVSFASRALLSAPVMTFAVPGLLWAILARPRAPLAPSRTVSLA